MVAKLSAGTFYGQTQKRWEVAGFTFVESVYTAQSRLHIPLHTHENAFLYFVIEGFCEEVYGRKSRTVCPSTLVLHPAGNPHSNRWHDAGGRALHIDIAPARAETIREYVPIQSGPAEFRNGLAPWLSGRLYSECQRQDPVSLLAMEGLALEILAEISRHRLHSPERTPPRWLLQARDLLHARFTENLYLDEIAVLPQSEQELAFVRVSGNTLAEEYP